MTGRTHSLQRCQSRTCRIDRSQLREYKLPSLLYFPVECHVAPQPPAQHQPQIDPVLWPEIAERTRHESLRALAATYGVSHETIRVIVRRVAERAQATA